MRSWRSCCRPVRGSGRSSARGWATHYSPWMTRRDVRQPYEPYETYGNRTNRTVRDVTVRDETRDLRLSRTRVWTVVNGVSCGVWLRCGLLYVCLII